MKVRDIVVLDSDLIAPDCIIAYKGDLGMITELKDPNTEYGGEWVCGAFFPNRATYAIGLEVSDFHIADENEQQRFRAVCPPQFG